MKPNHRPDVRRRHLVLTGVALLVPACSGDAAPGARPSGVDTPGAETIQASSLARGIEVLSSDAFGGRGPSSPGEDLTVEYLIGELRAAGAAPGNGDSFTQEVPLVSITVTNTPELTVDAGGSTAAYAYGPEFVAWTTRVRESEALEASEIVFVGYGVVAPEYGWNDYADVDVAGKTVVILVNDPGFATQDAELFSGNAMTYYGRWTYKFEEAARQGAAGAIVVHETEPAGYPWDVVSGSWTGPQFGLVADDDNMSRVQVEGWVTEAVAEEIFANAGSSYAELKAAALEPDFGAVALGATVSVSLENAIERSTSRNVLGIIRGSERPGEVIVYTAHWDHLGTADDPTLADPIYNGALDNASGTAGLLEIARAFGSLDPAPARSVAFLAVTAEEQGLLGSAHYAVNPVYPTASTVAAINMDGLNLEGPMRDVTVVGYGASELDGYLEEAAAEMGRYVRPDPEPEKGFYYRSDHFNFAKVGIPALYTDQGIDHVEFGEEYGLARREDYTANRYHKPSDEFDPTWDLSGAVADLRLLYTVGYRLATGDDWPSWSSDSEFKAIREADRGAQR